MKVKSGIMNIRWAFQEYNIKVETVFPYQVVISLCTVLYYFLKSILKSIIFKSMDNDLQIIHCYHVGVFKL